MNYNLKQYNYRDYLPLYQKYWDIFIDLYVKINKEYLSISLMKKVLREIENRGDITFELDKTEESNMFFMDYCVHNYIQSEKNLIELFYDQHNQSLSPDELVVIQAMMKSHCSIYKIKKTIPDVGVLIEDTLYNDYNRLLIDKSISDIPSVKLEYLIRILKFKDFSFCSGFMLPSFDYTNEFIADLIEDYLEENQVTHLEFLLKKQKNEFTKELICSVYDDFLLEMEESKNEEIADEDVSNSDVPL